jgi:TatD DNase family protein
MFDSHCHLDRCTEDPAAVLQRARSAGVTDLLIAGVDAKSWPAQNALWGPGVHIAWGVHPWRVANAPESLPQELRALKALLCDPPVPPAALGETGLDYGGRIDAESHTLQEQAFRTQIRLAHRYELPLILHVVRAHTATMEILRDEGLPKAGGLVHSFSGNTEQAQQYVAMGLHISFCGSVVHPKHNRVRHAAKHVPAEWLLVETDAPDQTPISRIPHPNEPAFLIDVVAAIADLRGSAAKEVADRTAANAHTLFRTQHP